MKRKVILDAGPLVALINARDKYHEWAEVQWEQIQPPLLTCEAVVSEACFLLRQWDEGAGFVFELLKRKAVEISFRLLDNMAPVTALLKKYGNVPMSMADACLVRMAEVNDSSSIMTLDAHFRIYRKHKTRTIPLLIPPNM